MRVLLHHRLPQETQPVCSQASVIGVFVFVFVFSASLSLFLTMSLSLLLVSPSNTPCQPLVAVPPELIFLSHVLSSHNKG